jgi:NADH dehydrogenase/NADH:ubiquinone oxidoreductase subunit G
MQTEISTYLQKIIRTEWSGNLIDICPVGALTSKTYAFMGRPWELRKNKSVDTTDVFGSEIYVFAKKNGNITAFDKKKSNFIEKEAVLRILPVFNNSLNEHWIHDKTRFRHDGNAFQRLSNINFVSLLKKNVFLETKTLAWDFYLKKTVLQSKNFAISKKKPTSFVSLKLKYFL